MDWLLTCAADDWLANVGWKRFEDEVTIPPPH
jgi:hypothetical protein